MRAARRARRRALLLWLRGGRLESLDGEGRARFERAIAEVRRVRAEMADADAGAWQLPRSEIATYVDTARARREALAGALDRAYRALFSGEVESPLRAPDPGERVVVLQPLLADRWAVLVEDASGVSAHRVDLGGRSRSGERDDGDRNEGEVLARLLLAPIADELSEASAIRFLVPGALRDVDLHAIDLGAGPLIERAIVTYGVDLPSAPASRGERVVLVADPRGDLAGAAGEGRALGAALSSGGSVALLSAASATHTAVRDAIDGARLFYYAGHATVGARDGLDSALLLADGGTLEVGDVLALSRAPEHVVLLGCETGRDTATRAVAGLGLAHAFVAAGARSVIATARPIDDRVASRFARALIETGDQFDAAHGRAAIRRLRAELDAVGVGSWSNVRVLVP
jgi:hypothetical protein